MSLTAITFNSLDMNDGVIYVTDTIDHTQPFDHNVPVFTLARSHGAVKTDNTYGSKVIPHTGKIHGTTQTDVQSKIDAFNAAMTAIDKNLDIGFAGTTRRYIATPQKARAWQDITASNWANFEIEYLVTTFGIDTSSTSLASGSTTVASVGIPVTVGGSAPLQPLTMTITVTAATGLTNKTISVTTPSGNVIAIRRTWTVGDILTIDETALWALSGQPVKVSSNPVDFTGYFPALAPSSSSQTLTLTNDFTTRTLTYSIGQVRRWL